MAPAGERRAGRTARVEEDDAERLCDDGGAIAVEEEGVAWARAVWRGTVLEAARKGTKRGWAAHAAMTANAACWRGGAAVRGTTCGRKSKT